MTTDMHLNGSAEPARRSNHMTEAEYDRERAALRQTYGDSKNSAGARYEQELSRLFARSGWTQQQLAKKEGQCRENIAKALLFGRFLDFCASFTTFENRPFSLPSGLTNGAFAAFWRRTDKRELNERIRFKRVIVLLQSEGVPMKGRPLKAIYSELLKQFGDGQWHSLAEMTEALGTTENHVKDNLSRFKRHRRAEVERKNVGPSFSYRIFQTEKTVSTTELTEKLAPIIKGLMAEGKKSMATMSPAAVDMLARQLKKLVDGWNE